MIAHVTDPPTGKQLPVAYVMIRGELREGIQSLSVQQMHEADVIIAIKDGSFVAWKDRHGEHGRKVSFAEAWKILRRAADLHARRPRGKKVAPRKLPTDDDEYMKDCFRDMT